MMYSIDELTSMNYRDLQTVAKKINLPANKKKDELIKLIMENSTAICAKVIPLTSTENNLLPVPEVLGKEDIIEESIASTNSISKTDVLESIQPIIQEEDKEYITGNNLYILRDGSWKLGTVKRVNKKTLRVAIDGIELTVPLQDVRKQIASDVSNLCSQNEVTLVDECLSASATESLVINDLYTDNSSVQPSISTVECDGLELAVVEKRSSAFFLPMDEIQPKRDSKSFTLTLSSRSATPIKTIQQRIKTPGSGRITSFPPASGNKLGTPSSLQKPKYTAKSTRAQMMRQEATLIKKKHAEEVEAKALEEATGHLEIFKPASIKPLNSGINLSKKATTNIPHRIALNPKPIKSICQSPSGNSAMLSKIGSSSKSFGSSYKAKPAPNFEKLHSKQFNSLKSITDFVERDDTIDVKMTSALENKLQDRIVASDLRGKVPFGSALKEVNNTNLSLSANSTENVRSIQGIDANAIDENGRHIPIYKQKALLEKQKKKEAENAQITVFKAKAMPNFKAIHKKLPTPNSIPKIDQSNDFGINKENRVTTAQSSSSKLHASNTPSKNLSSSFSASRGIPSQKKELVSSKKEDRRDSFHKHNKEQRTQNILQKRQMNII